MAMMRTAVTESPVKAALCWEPALLEGENESTKIEEAVERTRQQGPHCFSSNPSLAQESCSYREPL